MVQDNNFPRLERYGDKIQLIIDGKPFIMLAGETGNSSASSLKFMESVWEKVKKWNLNTLIMPVYWELMEPEEGVYDFTLVDGLIAQAREAGMRIVFLWFGTWKNASSNYVPEWVKMNPERFWRAEEEPGCGYVTYLGWKMMTLTPLCPETRKCDKRAFCALMEHIRDVDQEHTVLAIQVENEVGMLSSSRRDHSAVAEKAFGEQVNERLLTYLSEHEQELHPKIYTAWMNGSKKGTWREVFGKEADEIFMAWNYADFIGDIVSAGKKILPLPMAVNVWMVQYEGQRPGSYPSGGPDSRVIDIWRAAAPEIDIYAPDIYLKTFRDVCEMYVSKNNPLFIPEAGSKGANHIAGLFYALGEHQAICFAPFGIERIDRASDVPIPKIIMQGTENFERNSLAAPFAESYRLIQGMMPILQEYYGKPGTMHGYYSYENELGTELRFSKYIMEIKYLNNCPLKPVGGLVIELAENEFLIAGYGITASFVSANGDRPVDWLSVDEGEFEDGKWIAGLRLNGDESGIYMNMPCIRRVKVYEM